jgi:hypothetical protein
LCDIRDIRGDEERERKNRRDKKQIKVEVRGGLGLGDKILPLTFNVTRLPILRGIKSSTFLDIKIQKSLK